MLDIGMFKVGTKVSVEFVSADSSSTRLRHVGDAGVVERVIKRIGPFEPVYQVMFAGCEHALFRCSELSDASYEHDDEYNVGVSTNDLLKQLFDTEEL